MFILLRISSLAKKSIIITISQKNKFSFDYKDEIRDKAKG